MNNSHLQIPVICKTTIVYKSACWMTLKIFCLWDCRHKHCCVELEIVLPHCHSLILLLSSPRGMVFFLLFVLLMPVGQGKPGKCEAHFKQVTLAWKQWPLDIMSKFDQLDIKSANRSRSIRSTVLKYTHINTQADMWTVDVEVLRLPWLLYY